MVHRQKSAIALMLLYHYETDMALPSRTSENHKLIVDALEGRSETCGDWLQSQASCAVLPGIPLRVLGRASAWEQYHPFDKQASL